MKFAATSLLILTFSCVLFSQTPTPTPTPEYSETETPKQIASPTPKSPDGLTIDDLKAKAKQMKISGDTQIFYDKFRDLGHIRSKPRNIVGSWEGVGAIMASGGYGRAGVARLIMLSLECMFSGQRLTSQPDKYFLVFETQDAGFMFAKGSRTIYILVDDKRIEISDLGHDSDIKAGGLSNVRVEERFAYLLTREQANSLATAKKVEFLVGGNERPRTIKPDIRKDWQSVLDLTKK